MNVRIATPSFCLLLSLFSLLLLVSTQGQSCPPEDGKNLDAPAPSSLHGTVRLHDGTRSWISIVPDRETCGENEIELAFGERQNWERAKSFVDCVISARGTIADSVTAYYSSELNIFNPVITPDPTCKPRPVEPNPYKLDLPADLKSYRATVYVDVKHNLPLRGKVWSADGKALITPSWRAYAQPSLNGEEDLDLSCHEGFTLQSFSSDPSNASELFSPGVARLNSSEFGLSHLTIVCKRIE